MIMLTMAARSDAVAEEEGGVMRPIMLTALQVLVRDTGGRPATVVSRAETLRRRRQKIKNWLRSLISMVIRLLQMRHLFGVNFQGF